MTELRIDEEHPAWLGFFRWACGHDSRAKDWPELCIDYWPLTGGGNAIGGPAAVGWTPAVVVGVPEIVCSGCSSLDEEEHRAMVIELMGGGWWARPPLGWAGRGPAPPPQRRE